VAHYLRSDPVTTHAAQPAATESESLYQCPACGGHGIWSPVKQHVACRSCQSVVPLRPAAAGPVGGFAFIALLRDRPDSGRDWKPTATQVRCTTCLAVSTYDAQIVGRACDACGAPTMIPCDATGAPVNPGALLPFRISPEEAREKLTQWIKGQRVLRRRRHGASFDSVSALYLPCWAFSAHYHCAWRGEAEIRSGDDRKRVGIDGVVELDFADILIPATATLPHSMWDKVEPFPLSESLPFDTRYLAGFTVETYAVNMWDAWDAASARMQQEADRALKRDSSDNVAALEAWPKWTAERCKHVLVPLYRATYRHRGETYEVVVNGYTGTIEGTRPWDPIVDTLVVILMIAVPLGIIAGLVWLVRAWLG
jgi:hypothetical protein